MCVATIKQRRMRRHIDYTRHPFVQATAVRVRETRPRKTPAPGLTEFNFITPEMRSALSRRRGFADFCIAR